MKQFIVFFQCLRPDAKNKLWAREKDLTSREEAERYIEEQQKFLKEDGDEGAFRFHIVEMPE